MKSPNPQNLKGYYAVVRHSSDGYDYIDIGTLSGSSEVAMSYAKSTNERIPSWEHDNKIVGLAKVDLTVVNTELAR